MIARTLCKFIERASGSRIATQIRRCALRVTSSAFVLTAAVGSVNSFAPSPLVEKTPPPVGLSMTCADARGEDVSFRLSHDGMFAYIGAGPALTVERIIHVGDHLVAFANGDGIAAAARIGSHSSLTQTKDDGASSEATCGRIVLPRLQLRARA